MSRKQIIMIHFPFSYFSKIGRTGLDETTLYGDMIKFYLPLLKHLEEDEILPCTIAVSPLLLELWDQQEFQARFLQYLQEENEEDSLLIFSRWNFNLLNGLRYFYQEGKIECIPTTVSHCLLPYLSTRKGKQLQISYSISLFEAYFNEKPNGFWVEEGFLTEEIEELLQEEGIQYTFVNEQFLQADSLQTISPYISRKNLLILPYEEPSRKKVSGEMKTLTNIIAKNVEPGAFEKSFALILKNESNERLNAQLPKQFFIKNVHSLSTVEVKKTVNQQFADKWLNKQTSSIYTVIYEMEQVLWECMEGSKRASFLQMLKIWFIMSSKEWLQLLTKDNEMQEYVFNQLNIHIKQFESLYQPSLQKIIEDSTSSGNPFLFSSLTFEHVNMLKPTFTTEPLYAEGARKDTLNILMLSWEFPPLVVGGLARHVFDLSRTLAKQGHQVFVITAFVEGLPSYDNIQGVHVFRVLSLQPHHSDFFHWVNSLNAAMVHEGLRLFKQIPFHLVHAHDWLVGSAAQILQKQMNIPLICTIHATEHGRNNGIHNALQKSVHEKEKRLIHHSQAVIVCSEYMKKELIDLFYVQQDKISVFPNGIDPEMFLSQYKPNAIKKKYQLSANDRLVFSVGRIVHEKGFHILMEAAEKVCVEVPDVRFIIAGKGPLLHEYRSIVTEKKLEHHIKFIGYITDEERNQLLYLSEAVVFPSLYEPFGIVALEGMIVGKPTIVTDTGGLKTIVEDGISGIKVPPGDAAHLAKQITRLLQDKDYANFLGISGKKRAETMFGWEQIAVQTTKLFQSNVVSFQRKGGE